MKRRSCFVAATAPLLVLVGLMTIALNLGRFLQIPDTISPGDAIVVLGGEGRGYYRTQHALGLYKAGYAPRVVFSGGTLQDAGLACSSALLSQEAAQRLGLPEAAMIVAPESQSTFQEAINLGKLARDQGWRSLIVVTDPFPARRVSQTFRCLLPEIEVDVSAAPDPRFDAARWWNSEDGLVAVISEMVKLGYYWAKYGIPPA